MAAKRVAAAAPLTSEEARQQAQAEGLTLLVTDNKAGYFGVSLPHTCAVISSPVRRGCGVEQEERSNSRPKRHRSAIL